ncbi:hypothetical protein [Segeticoccus rhizosphaerae]|jgi:hypothetical protein|uniref:hypothetical protein n=1 Tax=Segeticoccus rhizosphaerae TaxID=1104777 RepID=UPI0010C085C7|nr:MULTISPECIES: hypothetical protein [Intrasporangiaceae]
MTVDLHEVATRRLGSTQTGGRPLPAWIPLPALALILVSVVVLGRQPLSDPDTWWHLRAGNYLLQSGHFTGPEPWSSFSSRLWVLHEWLPEVVMSRFAATFGLAGVSWVFCLGLVLVTVSLFVAARREAGPLAATAATAIGLIGMSASLSPRPQIVSFALLTLYTAAWLATARDLRPRWWMVPVTWLWASSHGMWFTGVLVGTAVIVGLALEHRVNVRQAFRLALVPVGCMVAAALTPVGPQLLISPLSVRGYAQFVAEWVAPVITDPAPMATLTMALVVAITWVRSARPTPWHQIAVLVVALGWTLLYGRTVAVGAAMTAPLFAGCLQVLLKQSRPHFARAERIFVFGVAALCMVVAAIVPGPSAPSAAAFPSALNGKLSQLPSGTVMLDAYFLGGWLLWQHPNLDLVIDGRTEVYAVSYVEDYMGALRADRGWDEFVRSSGAKVALVETGSPLATALQQRLSWRSDGSDAGYTLLRAP